MTPGHYLGPVPLRGLDPSARYRVLDENGDHKDPIAGAQLMTLGIGGDDAFGGHKRAARSRTLHLVRDGE